MKIYISECITCLLYNYYHMSVTLKGCANKRGEVSLRFDEDDVVVTHIVITEWIVFFVQNVLILVLKL
jgi:hypothetical protein